jgi:hypothetical protein
MSRDTLPCPLQIGNGGSPLAHLSRLPHKWMQPPTCAPDWVIAWVSNALHYLHSKWRQPPAPALHLVIDWAVNAVNDWIGCRMHKELLLVQRFTTHDDWEHCGMRTHKDLLIMQGLQWAPPPSDKASAFLQWKETVDDMWCHPHITILTYQHVLEEHAVHKRQASPSQQMFAAQTILL